MFSPRCSALDSETVPSRVSITRGNVRFTFKFTTLLVSESGGCLPTESEAKRKAWMVPVPIESLNIDSRQDAATEHLHLPRPALEENFLRLRILHILKLGTARALEELLAC